MAESRWPRNGPRLTRLGERGSRSGAQIPPSGDRQVWKSALLLLFPSSTFHASTGMHAGPGIVSAGPSDPTPLHHTLSGLSLAYVRLGQGLIILGNLSEDQAPGDVLQRLNSVDWSHERATLNSSRGSAGPLIGGRSVAVV
jgi:hypothetical protein